MKDDPADMVELKLSSHYQCPRIGLLLGSGLNRSGRRRSKLELNKQVDPVSLALHF